MVRFLLCDILEKTNLYVQKTVIAGNGGGVSYKGMGGHLGDGNVQSDCGGGIMTEFVKFCRTIH